MTPEQALNVLDNVVANVSLSRKNHNTAQQATMVLNSLIQAGKPKKEAAPAIIQKKKSN